MMHIQSISLGVPSAPACLPVRPFNGIKRMMKIWGKQPPSGMHTLGLQQRTKRIQLENNSRYVQERKKNEQNSNGQH